MLSTTTARRLATRAATTSSSSILIPATSRFATPAAAAAAAQLIARRGYATPLGPPPKGFRQLPPKKWDEDDEKTFTKLGKYFLMTEMARGMYILLEQFFRPP
jgi:NADH dehydrogenase (ubiquinone) Fe-S protein 8